MYRLRVQVMAVAMGLMALSMILAAVKELAWWLIGQLSGITG